MNDRFGALQDWQGMLDRYAELFSEMNVGSRVGFVARADSGMLPGKHVAGVTGAAGTGRMLAWERQGTGMQASIEAFSGINDSKVDLLFVAEEEALEAARESLSGETLSVVKRLIRKGGIMFYVMKNKYQLQDAGYEEFLDSLGLAFLGACR
jgi:hypothetical protein